MIPLILKLVINCVELTREMFFASIEHEQIFEGGYSPNFLRPIPRVEDDINENEVIVNIDYLVKSFYSFGTFLDT